MTRAAVKWFLAIVLFAALHSKVLFAAQQKAATPQQNGPFKFESKVNVVLVPVLVLDGRGLAVGNLTQRDFRIFDKGKEQLISGFTVERRAGEYTKTQLSSRARDSERTSESSRLPDPLTLISRRFIAFLFDDVHLSVEELVHVRAAGTRMLGESLNATDMAAVLSTSGRTNTGFTRDRAKLQDAISKLWAAPLHVGQHSECPDLDPL